MQQQQPQPALRATLPAICSSDKATAAANAKGSVSSISPSAAAANDPRACSNSPVRAGEQTGIDLDLTAGSPVAAQLLQRT